MGVDDERFSHIANDPKFRRIPKGERKVKIDKRFKSMFEDKKFKVKYTVDKRGRPVSHNSKEDLKRYYHVESESSNDDESNNEAEGKGTLKALKSDDEYSDDLASKDDTNDLNEKHKNDKEVSKSIQDKLKDLKVDYARGEAALISDSSSDDDEDESEGSDNEDIEHKWGELDVDAERTEEITARLAICNMDWDRIRAVDLMVLFNSFLPPGGLIHSIHIYPSEFGLQRMKEEEVSGPIELVDKKLSNEEIVEDNEEGSKFHMEKLRQYQLNRLKYYYAVMTCDSANTANKIYTECDGMEYESTATKIDLRFIPEDMTFDVEPKEVLDKLPDLTKYKPRFFTTTALQQAKVDLTWDETNPERVELTTKLKKGKVDEITDTDLQNYLASSSEEDEIEEESIAQNANDDEEEDETKNPIDKYKALLQEIEENEKSKKERDVEMEITWGIDLKNKTEKLVKQKMTENENKTPFQKYLNKVKDKRKEKRLEKKKKHQGDGNDDDSDVPSDIDMNDSYFAEEFKNGDFKKNKGKKNITRNDELTEEDKQKEAELELLLLNEDEDNKKHFSLKKLQDSENASKKKRKMKKKNDGDDEDVKDEFQVNVNDDRFSALFTSHHYNIDPTDSHYKKTKGMEKLIEEKIKRRTDEDSQTTKKRKLDDKNTKNAELSVLVKSVKRKAEAFQMKSK